MAWINYISVNTADISNDTLNILIDDALVKTSKLFGFVVKKEAYYDNNFGKYIYKLTSNDIYVLNTSNAYNKQGDIYIFDSPATLLIRQKITNENQMSESAKEYFRLMINYLVLLKREEINNELGSNTVLGAEMTQEKPSMRILIEEYRNKIKEFEKNIKKTVIYTGKMDFVRSYRRITGDMNA